VIGLVAGGGEPGNIISERRVPGHPFHARRKRQLRTRAIKANDPQQASAWTRDLALFEVVISLIRNIQPMDLGDDAADGPASATPGLAAADADEAVSIN
jgi:hypothetical protein